MISSITRLLYYPLNQPIRGFNVTDRHWYFLNHEASHQKHDSDRIIWQSWNFTITWHQRSGIHRIISELTPTKKLPETCFIDLLESAMQQNEKSNSHTVSFHRITLRGNHGKPFYWSVLLSMNAGPNIDGHSWELKAGLMSVLSVVQHTRLMLFPSYVKMDYFFFSFKYVILVETEN